MRIETEHNVIIDSEKVKYYKWTDSDGGNSMIGTNKDWHLTAFMSNGVRVSIIAFKQKFGLNPNKNAKRSNAYSLLKHAFINDISFLSFRGMKNDN